MLRDVGSIDRDSIDEGINFKNLTYRQSEYTAPSMKKLNSSGRILSVKQLAVDSKKELATSSSKRKVSEKKVESNKVTSSRVNSNLDEIIEESRDKRKSTSREPGSDQQRASKKKIDSIASSKSTRQGNASTAK